MAEEIINLIAEAEAEAEQIRTTAQEKAAVVIANAETQAIQQEQAAAERCKVYRETQIKTAIDDAENEYKNTFSASAQSAKAYCEEILSKADAVIGEIVGRIVSGDC